MCYQTSSSCKTEEEKLIMLPVYYIQQFTAIFKDTLLYHNFHSIFTLEPHCSHTEKKYKGKHNKNYTEIIFFVVQED